MTREDAIEIVRNIYQTDAEKEALDMLIPELAESEDERVEKLITDSVFYQYGASAEYKDVLDYLDRHNSEKQKDASKAIEAVERIDKYIDEHLANAHDMKDSNPDKKYYRGWDDALGKIAGILQDVYSGKKQKEPHFTKRNALFDKCVENCDPMVMKEVSDEVDDMLEKEQKPNIEICPDSETGYPIEDCDYGLEIALDILEKTLGKVQGFQTDDGIREHQTAIKAVKDAMEEQKSVEKPINWTELTWKDIIELEGIINKVHYEFRNGIGQESFGKEVLEKFREYKGDEYLDEIEQKSIDKVEPKFKVGDKVKLASEPKYPAREIVEIKDGAYYFDSAVHLPFVKQDEWELVEDECIKPQPEVNGEEYIRNLENLESIVYYAKSLPDDTRTNLGNFLRSLRKDRKTCGVDEFSLTLRNRLSTDSELTDEQANTFARTYGEDLYKVALGEIKTGLEKEDIEEYRNEVEFNPKPGDKFWVRCKVGKDKSLWFDKGDERPAHAIQGTDGMMYVVCLNKDDSGNCVSYQDKGKFLETFDILESKR